MGPAPTRVAQPLWGPRCVGTRARGAGQEHRAAGRSPPLASRALRAQSGLRWTWGTSSEAAEQEVSGGHLAPVGTYRKSRLGAGARGGLGGPFAHLVFVWGGFRPSLRQGEAGVPRAQRLQGSGDCRAPPKTPALRAVGELGLGHRSPWGRGDPSSRVLRPPLRAPPLA